jgi:hypothetical protein
MCAWFISFEEWFAITSDWEREIDGIWWGLKFRLGAEGISPSPLDAPENTGGRSQQN